MRIIRNTEYIKNRRRRARLAAGLGFLLLMSVWAIWFYPTFIVFAYGFLILGYLVFSYGMAQMGKWNRTPRADNILDERLKPLPDKFTLIHYATLGKHTVEHMLVHPGGVVALTARAIPGTIKGRGSRWRRTGFGLTRLFGSGPQLGNPSFETQQSIAAIEQALRQAQLEVDVGGAIVFVNPQVNLDVEETDYPALLVSALPNFVRLLPEDASIKPAERQQVVEVLSGGAAEEAPERPRSTRRPVRARRPAKADKTEKPEKAEKAVKKKVA